MTVHSWNTTGCRRAENQRDCARVREIDKGGWLCDLIGGSGRSMLIVLLSSYMGACGCLDKRHPAEGCDRESRATIELQIARLGAVLFEERERAQEVLQGYLELCPLAVLESLPIEHADPEVRRRCETLRMNAPRAIGSVLLDRIIFALTQEEQVEQDKAIVALLGFRVEYECAEVSRLNPWRSGAEPSIEEQRKAADSIEDLLSGSPDPGVREAAIDWLALYSLHHEALLLEYLDDPDPCVRVAAIAAVGVNSAMARAGRASVLEAGIDFVKVRRDDVLEAIAAQWRENPTLPVFRTCYFSETIPHE